LRPCDSAPQGSCPNWQIRVSAHAGTLADLERFGAKFLVTYTWPVLHVYETERRHRQYNAMSARPMIT
jgi:hypothetical protein